MLIGGTLQPEVGFVRRRDTRPGAGAWLVNQRLAVKVTRLFRF
jgi:hypothetical protein